MRTVADSENSSLVVSISGVSGFAPLGALSELVKTTRTQKTQRGTHRSSRGELYQCAGNFYRRPLPPRVVHACTRAHQAAHKQMYRVFAPPRPSERLHRDPTRRKNNSKRTKVVAGVLCHCPGNTQPGTATQLRARKPKCARIHGLQTPPGPPQTGMYRLFWWIWSKWWFWS